MSLSAKNTQRGSILGIQARRGFFLLPPNSPIVYCAATAAASFTSTSFATFPGRQIGGLSNAPGTLPANVSVQATSATGFLSTMALEVEVVGVDENYFPIREVVRCVGNAAATQNFATNAIFAQINAINYRDAGGVSVSGSLASFSVGIGDGAATPTNLVVQNPIPEIQAPASIAFMLTGVSAISAGSYILANLLTLPDAGRFRGVRLASNYTATVNVRVAQLVTYGLDYNTMES